MTLTTQHLEELLRLALVENERLSEIAEKADRLCAHAVNENTTLNMDLKRAKTETMGRLYMDPEERTALARDLAEAHVTLGLAAETLRRRNQTESNRCERLYNRMGEWVRKLKVMS